MSGLYEREARLVAWLEAFEAVAPLRIGYAFYDCHPNGKPLVLEDPDYHENVAPAVVCISKGSHRLTTPQAFAPVNPLFATVDFSVPLD